MLDSEWGTLLVPPVVNSQARPSRVHQVKRASLCGFDNYMAGRRWQIGSVFFLLICRT